MCLGCLQKLHVSVRWCHDPAMLLLSCRLLNLRFCSQGPPDHTPSLRYPPHSMCKVLTVWLPNSTQEAPLCSCLYLVMSILSSALVDAQGGAVSTYSLAERPFWTVFPSASMIS